MDRPEAGAAVGAFGDDGLGDDPGSAKRIWSGVESGHLLLAQAPAPTTTDALLGRHQATEPQQARVAPVAPIAAAPAMEDVVLEVLDADMGDAADFVQAHLKRDHVFVELARAARAGFQQVADVGVRDGPIRVWLLGNAQATQQMGHATGTWAPTRGIIRLRKGPWKKCTDEMILWKMLRTLLFELCNAVHSVDLVGAFSVATGQQVRAIQAIESRTFDSAEQHLSTAIDECGWPADLMRDYTHTREMKDPLRKHTAVTLDLLEKHKHLLGQNAAVQTRNRGAHGKGERPKV